jgi:hypothetical protein
LWNQARAQIQDPIQKITKAQRAAGVGKIVKPNARHPEFKYQYLPHQSKKKKEREKPGVGAHAYNPS